MKLGLVKWRFIFLIFIPVLGVTGCVSAPIETVYVPADNKGWKVGYVHDAGWGKGSIVEYIPENEAISNWSKLLTIQFLEGNKDDPEQFMNKLRVQMQGRCANLTWNVLHKNSDSILYEWVLRGCKPHSNQHEIAKLLKGNDGLHRISYTQKDSQLSEDTRSRWVKWFTEAYIQKGGQRVLVGSN